MEAVKGRKGFLLSSSERAPAQKVKDKDAAAILRRRQVLKNLSFQSGQRKRDRRPEQGVFFCLCINPDTVPGREIYRRRSAIACCWTKGRKFYRAMMKRKNLAWKQTPSLRNPFCHKNPRVIPSQRGFPTTSKMT